MMSAKILVIGKGEFGNSLAQGLELSSIPFSEFASVSVEQVSTIDFLKMTIDEMSAKLVNASYVMYCGRKLSEHAEDMASALLEARKLSTMSADNGPLLEFIDWSNPDPRAESFDGAVVLSSALNEKFSDHQIVWKVTGVSSMDIALSEGHLVATVYSSSQDKLKPSLDLPGLTWKVADKNTLLSEVSSRLMTRAEVDRWYDTAFLGLAVFLVGFGYVFTRYTKWVNGSYGWTMVPLYVLDKAIAWSGLWMICAAPFAGNLLALSHVFSSWEKSNGVDKSMSVICTLIMIVPVILFSLPWLTWAVIRNAFASWSPTNNKKMSMTKSMLVDIISLKTETGVFGFAFLITHAFMGGLVAIPQYKSKWFDPDNKDRFYGNYEVSLASGVIAVTLVTIITIRSLIGKGSWMKLKPLYTYVSPLAIFLSTLHLIMMGFKGWNTLFNYSSHKGQPSPTFTASMFSLGVVAAHIFLAIVGTKRRVRKDTRVMKHSAVEAAFARYNEVRLNGGKYGHVEKTEHDESPL